MNGRNKISLALIILIISSAAVAIIITVRDYNQIINDFNDFVNNPFTWNNIHDNEGTMKLFLSGEVTENETIGTATTLASLPSSLPFTYDIFSLYLTITGIKVRTQIGTIITLSSKSFTIDLINLNNSVQFYESYNLKENNYTALHIYYDRNVLAVTSDGNKTFIMQGSDFFPVTFYKNRYNNTKMSMQIKHNVETKLLLSISLQLRFQQLVIIPHMNAYLEF
ncbi:MAG: hypothetical protein ACTSSG_10995 [Candidatus Heimdallarchaeaceae archaeon]